MMDFWKASEEEIWEVAFNMRKRDFEEIECVTWCEGRYQLADYIAHSYSQHDNVYACGTEKDGAIAILSYLPLRPGVWSVGMFATNKFKKIGKFLTKCIIKDIIPSLNNANFHRVEAQSICGYEEIHHWLNFIGLKEECEVKGFGRNGEDFKTFAFVKPKNLDAIWKGNGDLQCV